MLVNALIIKSHRIGYLKGRPAFLWGRLTGADPIREQSVNRKEFKSSERSSETETILVGKFSENHEPQLYELFVSFLMTILSQSFFSLVCRHFMSFSFFTRRHGQFFFKINLIIRFIF